MKLTDFPNEILHNITSHVDLNSDLAKITLVSHRFKNLAEPLLYRSVHLNVESLEESRTVFLQTVKRADQLLANLTARPERGEHTTAFSLRVASHHWYQSHRHTSIVSNMPGLRQLSYSPPDVDGEGLPAELKNLAALRLDFNHLASHYREDDLSWLDHGVPLRTIAKHLWHPSLRKLQAENLFFGDNFRHERWLRSGPCQKPCNLSPVEDLRFLDCCPRIDRDVVAAFINSIRRLRCFVLEIKSPWNPLVIPNDRAPAFDARPALLAHQTTIEELAICTTNHAVLYYNHVQSPSRFIQWTALKRLAIPSAMLSGDLAHRAMLHEVLPPQLEELQLEKQPLTFPGHDVYGSEATQAVRDKELRLMEELAKNKEVRVPGLKRLILWFQHPSSPKSINALYSIYASVDDMDALESSFRLVGVLFEWISAPHFRDTPFGERLYEW